MNDDFRVAYSGKEYFVRAVFSDATQRETDLQEIQIWNSTELKESFHPHTPDSDFQNEIRELTYERYGFSLVLEEA